MRLSSGDNWKIADSFEGTFITGGTGSGKTSGSGAAIASAFLGAGYGGLVLCADMQECERWAHMAKKAGRAHHLIIVDESEKERFNLLQYSLAISKDGMIDNVVALLMLIAEISRGGSEGASTENPFWQQQLRRLLSNALSLLYAAYGKLEYSDIIALATSAPNNETEAKSEEWQKQSFLVQTFKRALMKPSNPISQHDYAAIQQYFRFDFGRLDGRTRTNIIATLTGVIDPFLRGKFHRLFATETTFAPEMSRDGLIIIINLPVTEYQEFGQIAQCSFKYIWQRAMMRKVEEIARPVFLWADEYQFFLHEFDSTFQSVIRKNRGGSVYLTQNISSIYARMKSQNAPDTVRGLLGNFQTKIFHQNMDVSTNELAAELIGKEMKQRNSSGSTSSYGGYVGESPIDGGFNVNKSKQTNKYESHELIIEPSDFARLEKGGKGTTEAIILLGGRKLKATGDVWAKVKFRQQ